MSGTSYDFRPMTPADLAVARRWLRTPEVRRWWGDPDEQLASLAEGFDEPRVAMWIVSCESGPFAYVQDYDPLAWDGHPLGGLPPGSRGIDQFIGEPDMLNRGHGSAFIRAHVGACSPAARRLSAPTPTRPTPAPSAPTARPASPPSAKPRAGKANPPC